MNELLRRLQVERRSGLKPPPKLSLVEWADQNRMLSSESSSQPGRWKTSSVEVARGPMMAVTEKGIHTITVMACTQLLKTELINNIVGYFMDNDPSPMIVMQPTGKLAEAWSKDRFDTMLRDTPCLKNKVKDKRLKDANNTILHKSFPGGHVSIVASNSPSDLAMRPIRVVLCDEVDKYPASAGDEGDPIKLVSERTATFWNRLKVHVCSPTNEGRSRIAHEYKQSDQRIYMVPCLDCGHKHEMKWSNVVWPEGEPEKAKYYCPECGSEWDETKRLKAISKGHWMATKPTKGHAGFRCSKLNSPWETMAELARKFVESKESPMLLKTFINTQLAETWKEKAEMPDWKRLYEYRESYSRGIVPIGGVFLTMGVDVQKDRIECQIRAWGRRKENWLVDYVIIDGDTSEDEPWHELDEQIEKVYSHENGSDIPIKLTAIDSGYNTQKVYDYVKNKSIKSVIAVKGSDTLQMTIGIPKSTEVRYKSGTKAKRGVRVYPVGSSIIKSEIYSWLRSTKPINEEAPLPPGFCHHYEIDEEFFKQLTAERLVEKSNSKGYTSYQWEKMRERNEALDTFVYARAAASAVGLDRYKDSNWEKLEKELGIYHTRIQKQEKPKESSPLKTYQSEKKRLKRRPKRSVWDR